MPRRSIPAEVERRGRAAARNRRGCCKLARGCPDFKAGGSIKVCETMDVT